MLAFLFTDLESSTRLWEEHPEAMGGALARHDTILHEAVEAASGNIVKTTGDGLIAVFGSALDSVAASLEAQRALGAEAWGPTGPLRVRMGIHAGEAEHRDGDYFGPALNRAARIMAAGHGGQVLLSGVAAHLAGGQLPPGTALRSLGTHRLKDLTLPEDLFQLIHTDLETEFPPLASLESTPNNLPTQASEFFGRSIELASIQTMLEDPITRLVTLIGPGGTGKTRLGLQVAADQIDRYRDGVFFVDLSPERDADAAFEAIVRALGFPVSGEGHPLQVLKARLRDRQMLLVLDNFEQVTEAAAGIAELLQVCPELKVVATSREALRVRAEHVYPVPPMTLPTPNASSSVIAESEAVRLFIERARSVRPGFALTEENASVIAEICIRLDGLPLAIELAAARLNVFSPRDLRDRLQDRIAVLGGGGRDLPARQRTLWGTIEWSYELLDRQECQVFELMSVFSTARLVAVEEVAATALGNDDVLDVLASLVDKSLVRSDESGGSQRFWMLQTIREYAAERLAGVPEVEAATRQAHAVYFSGYAQRLRHQLQGPDRESALDELESEIGNLRAAWRFWVERGDLEQLYLLLDGLWALHDAKGWYHAAIELARDMLRVLATADPSPEHAAEELTLRTSLARALMAVWGYTSEVEEAFKQALELSDTAGGAAHRFPVLRALATYYMNIADFGSGVAIGRELLDLAERERDESILIEGHLVFGSATAFTGDLEVGLPHLDRAIELFDPKTHGSGRYRLGTNPGVVARIAAALIRWQCGALDQAVAGATEALELARELNHPFSLAYALYHNGFLDFNRGRFEQTRERAIELTAVASENQYAVWQTLATVLEGIALSGLGDVEEGLAKTEAGVDLYQGLTTPPVFWPLILGLRAFVFGMAGQPERGLALVEEAIEASGAQEIVSPEFRTQRGDLIRLLPEPDPVEAEEAYRAAIRGARAGAVHLLELQAMTRLVELRREQGRTPDGSDELRTLYETLTEGFGERDLVAARAVLGVG